MNILMNISVMRLELFEFEKDYKRYIEYRFWGLFPISLDATTVSYEGTQHLKATASFIMIDTYSGQSRSINCLQWNR